MESTLGETYALRTLDVRGLQRAAALAASELSARFGTTDPAGWREARTMIAAGAQGLANPPPIALLNRGSYEQIVELGP